MDELLQDAHAFLQLKQLDAIGFLLVHTNFAKIDPETGKVNKRKDGKVLKPEGWEPPKLKPFLHD